MFGLIKKKKEYDLADQIPVDNLKKYVVQGYEKEKSLESQIEKKDSEIEKLQNEQRKNNCGFEWETIQHRSL